VPDFRASEASVSSVAVWVRLPELPVEYYHKDSLMHIGSGLGPVLRVDFNTASGTRGRFARLCVQLDLDKPLMRTVRVGKLRLAVVYEGIGLLCFKCGKLGHKQEFCPSSVSAESGGSNATAPATVPPEDSSTGFGPWMLVTRRKRQTKPDSQQAVVDSTVRGRSVIVHDVPSVEMHAGGSGTAAITVDNHPPRGTHQDKGKASKLLAGGSSQQVSKASKRQGGPSKEHRGPPTIANPPKPSLNSLQSLVPGPSNSLVKPKEPLSPVAPSSSTKTCPLLQTEHTISLRPQAPTPRFRNDKHQVGPHPDAGSTAQLVDQSQWQSDSDNGRHHRANSEGSSPRLGVVQRESNPCLGRDNATSPNRRLSRSPSPNRFGLASGSQPILELLDGCPRNRRSQLSIEDSLTAVAQAPIQAISGGGVQCNVNRVRREESAGMYPQSN
jgi:hypothetical protein